MMEEFYCVCKLGVERLNNEMIHIRFPDGHSDMVTNEMFDQYYGQFNMSNELTGLYPIPEPEMPKPFVHEPDPVPEGEYNG